MNLRSLSLAPLLDHITGESHMDTELWKCSKRPLQGSERTRPSVHGSRSALWVIRPTYLV